MDYDERLRPPWWSWLLLVGGAAALAPEVYGGWGLATALVVTAILVGIAAIALLRVAGTRIRIGNGVVEIGGTTMAAEILGPACALDRAATRRRLGAGADPAARLLVRAWIPTAVEIALPAGGPPYWLVSTRHPNAFVAAVERARSADRRGERGAEVTAARNGDTAQPEP